MPTTDDINAYYNSLPEDQRRQAIESGALEAAIQAQSLEPLQAYAPAPAPPPVEPAPPRAERPGEIEIPPGTWDIVQMRPFREPANLRLPSGEVLTIRMLGGENEFGTVEVESSRGWSGAYALGTKGSSPATLVAEGYKVRLMNPTYTTDNPATTVPGQYQEPWQARPLAISVVRTDEQGRELDDFAFGRAPAAGKYETASPETSYIIGGLSPDAMASIRTNLAAGGERAEAMRQSVQEDVLKSAVAYPQSPNYGGADIGPSIPMQTGAEWGRQKAIEWGGSPAPPPTTMPQPDLTYIPRDIPEGYLPSDYSPGQAGMVALGQLTPAQRAEAIRSGAARQAYEKGDIGALNPYAKPHEFDPPPLRGTPAEGFQGTDILMAGGGLATLRGFGGAPTPATERAPQPGGPAQPPAMGMDVGSFYYPFAGLGVLGREVQGAGERFSSYLGRAGRTWIEEVGGIRPEPMPLPSEISADAQRYMKGGITETEITTAPAYPMQADSEGKLGSQSTTITTFRPFVDAEVTVRGEAGKGGKETFTEMLVGPPDPFRYITNIGPIKLPFKIGPIGRNEKVPLASEAYRLRAAPGVFTREVGSAVGLGIVKPVGQVVSALENPLQAGMAAPGVALAFGVGLAMLPGQIAMTTALNPAAGAGQVYGLVAPFSLAGKLRGARFDAKPTADIQFPGYSESGVLLEVPKRGPIVGHVDLGGVVASRIMGRPVRSTVQVGEGGVFEIPLEWIDRPVVGGRAVSAEGLLRGLEIERRFSVDLAQGRTAEMQVPGNIEMRGSLRAQSKSISGFHDWLNKKGAEGLEDFQPRSLRVTKDISYAKGELGNVDFSRPTEINIASEQFPSLRGWDARLDNPQFAKAYWEAERAETIKTIGHEFRHSIQPNYYEWKAKNFPKTKGLLEYDAERFAEQARAAWEAEVGPAAPERVYINKNLEPEFGAVARLKEELIATVPRTAETVDVFRLGRAGEAEIEMFGEYFVPATREGTAYVKGAPKDLFKPVYETVKTAEPWMKGTKDLRTVDTFPSRSEYHIKESQLRAHALKEHHQMIDKLSKTQFYELYKSRGFRAFTEEEVFGKVYKGKNKELLEEAARKGTEVWKISKEYPIVRPQSLLERITRRPAEEIKLVPQKRLLGYEATLSRETSGRVGEFMLGKTSPKGTIIRPTEIRLTTFEPLEGLTPKEIGAEATYGGRAAPANLGLTEGAKGEPVFLGGIGAKPKATYSIKPEQFGLVPKALERFGLKSGLVGGRLEVEFGGVKGAPSLYDFPVGAAAKGGAIKIRPGLAEEARGKVGGLLERIREIQWRQPRTINYPGEHIGKKVKIPGPGDRRGSIFDYVEADRQEIVRGAAASRAGDRSVDIGARGYTVGTGGAKAGSGGLISLSRGRKATLADIEAEGAMSSFRFYSAPGSKMTLQMPGASLRGGALGLATGALGLRGKVGVSEAMFQGQKDATRLLDVVMERSRATQDLRMPGVLERERARVGVDVLRLERDKVTLGVGQIPLVGQRQQVRVGERVGQTERQMTVQKVDVVPRLTTDDPFRERPPPGSPPRQPPITPPRIPPFWAHLPGGYGGFRGFRPSLKKNPIATIADISRGIRPPTSLLGSIRGMGKPPKRSTGKRKSTGRKKGGRRKR